MPVSNEQSQQQKNQKPIRTKWKAVEPALDDVRKTFGFVPSFVENFTDQSIPGAWNEAKSLRFSPGLLGTKLKGLIALGVSAQIPCTRIKYFEEKATQAEGVTLQEQHEAILMSAITRHWSTVLNGSLLDKKEFRAEADKVMAYVKKMMDDSGGKLPPEEMFLVEPQTAAETFKDIEKTLGLVPKFFQLFPKAAIPGGWSEFKGLQLNPHTALNGKQKELIGLGVAAQIPCDYCTYFHRSAAVLNGATEDEIQEAIATSALTRHWSTVFHGPNLDLNGFQKDADRMLEFQGKRSLQ